jgi:UDP-N-acetylglucosamine---dolichyl-phosphate N-acetylglucosaminyltransferase
MMIGKEDFWVVIPAYNEEKHITEVVRKVKAYAKNILVVDDGSKDSTYSKAMEEVPSLKHIINLGKGAGLKTGCDYAIMKGARFIIVMDADGQHDPKELPKFIRALANGSDVVLGIRKFNKDMPSVLRFGNWFIDSSIKLLYGMKVKDTQCGYRAFTAEAYQKIRWKASDYSMESEMIANIGRHHLRFTEVQIKTIYSDKYKGTTVIDGIKIVFNMIIWRLRSLR